MDVAYPHIPADTTRKKITILTIEDEPDFRQALKIRLETNGYTVLEAEDGIRGLAMARTHNPDLILLDVLLPGIDGFKVARCIKGDVRYNHIPVVMLTVCSQQHDRDTGRAVGANAYVTKPYESQNLLGTISTLVAG